jgi:hypothetical protein
VHISAEVQQLSQRGWLGNVEVVASDESQPPTSIEELLQGGLEKPNTTVQYESYDNVDRLCLLNVRQKMLDQGILAPGDQRSTMRREFDRWLFSTGPEVVSLVGDDMPHAAAGVVDVSKTPWDDVHMKVRNGLAAGSAFVEADIEAIHGVAIAQ